MTWSSAPEHTRPTENSVHRPLRISAPSHDMLASLTPSLMLTFMPLVRASDTILSRS